MPESTKPANSIVEEVEAGRPPFTDIRPGGDPCDGTTSSNDDSVGLEVCTTRSMAVHCALRGRYPSVPPKEDSLDMPPGRPSRAQLLRITTAPAMLSYLAPVLDHRSRLKNQWKPRSNETGNDL